MKTIRQAKQAVRFGLAGLACLSLVAACKAPGGAPPIPLKAAGQQAVASSAAGPVGTANLVVRLTEDKRLPARSGERTVQSVDLARATSIYVRVAGAGINGWQTITSNGTFGAADGNGIRTANFSSTTVPAGARRIFQVEVRDGGTQIEELWGVADITAGATTTVTVTRAGTPTAKIFHKLLATRNAPLALALDIAQVQGFVDKLLNVNSATGAVIDGGKPTVSYALVNVDLAANAIAIGEGGQSYRVPAAVPANLIPTPVRKSELRIKAVDIKGQTTSNECVVFVTDPSSSVVRTPGGSGVDVTFSDITPGTWTANVIDLGNGRQAAVNVTLSENQSKVVTVTLPPQDVEVLLGAYNLENSQAYGYNGDGLHPSLAYLNAPRKIAIHSGVLYLVDSGNRRIRSLDMTSNAPVLKTVAGNGLAATVIAAENADALQVPLNISDQTHLTFDENGNMLFTERDLKRVAKLDKATGKVTTVMKTTDIPGWDSGDYPGVMYYHVPSRMLYIGGADETLYSRMFEINMATFPAAGAVKQITTKFNGGLIREGNFLFYGTGYQDYQLIRRNVTDNSEVIMIGKSKVYKNGDGVPAQELYTESGWGGQAWMDFSLDAQGNLFCTNQMNGLAIYRVTDVLNGDDTSNNWLANNLKVSNPAAVAYGTAIDPATGNLLFSGTGAVPNPVGSGSTSVHAINVLRP